MKKLVVFVFVLLGATLLLAHPHFNKTVTAELPGGVEAIITYQTVPANEEHAQNAENGTFITPRSPLLKISGELQSGSVTIPAGELIIGVVKNSAEDWSLALYPGKIGRGETADSSKLIKLDSMFFRTTEPIEHLTIDITPGHGRLEGKAVLSINFGTLTLHGALT
ncbi:hypothetical protein MYX82_10245 [Acidobacteria bacterium AH-259-D05]|nr:hypothetical protein [Acidobacteria bacterium AH-259-D05]